MKIISYHLPVRCYTQSSRLFSHSTLAPPQGPFSTSQLCRTSRINVARGLHGLLNFLLPFIILFLLILLFILISFYYHLFRQARRSCIYCASLFTVESLSRKSDYSLLVCCLSRQMRGVSLFHTSSLF